MIRRITFSISLIVTGVILVSVVSPSARFYRNCDEDHLAMPYVPSFHLGPGGNNPDSIFVTSAYFRMPLASCDITENNCGVLTPSPNTIFIADGAYNSVDETIFFLDVPNGADGVFQFDPETCTIVSGTYYSINYNRSQRGIAFDPNRYEIWAGGPCDGRAYRYSAEPPYAYIEELYVGYSVWGAAFDPINDYLLLASNASPDQVYVYDPETLYLLGTYDVPWQGESNGYDSAGMAFDEDNGQIVMVNQCLAGRGETLEVFDFDLENGLTPAGYCNLSFTAYAWGLAIIEDGDPQPWTFTSYVTDIGDTEAPFFIDRY